MGMGVGSFVLAFVHPPMRLMAIIAAVSMLVAGVVMFLVDRFVRSITDKLPKPKGFGKSMAQASKNLSHILSKMEHEEKVARLRSEGLTGKATIFTAIDTGKTMGTDPIYQFELQVTVEGRPPYKTVLVQLAPKFLVSRFQEGAVFNVLVDRNDPHNLVLQWV